MSCASDENYFLLIAGIFSIFLYIVPFIPSNITRHIRCPCWISEVLFDTIVQFSLAFIFGSFAVVALFSLYYIRIHIELSWMYQLLVMLALVLIFMSLIRTAGKIFVIVILPFIVLPFWDSIVENTQSYFYTLHDNGQMEMTMDTPRLLTLMIVIFLIVLIIIFIFKIFLFQLLIEGIILSALVVLTIRVFWIEGEILTSSNRYPVLYSELDITIYDKVCTNSLPFTSTDNYLWNGTQTRLYCGVKFCCGVQRINQTYKEYDYAWNNECPLFLDFATWLTFGCLLFFRILHWLFHDQGVLSLCKTRVTRRGCWCCYKESYPLLVCCCRKNKISYQRVQ